MSAVATFGATTMIADEIAKAREQERVARVKDRIVERDLWPMLTEIAKTKHVLVDALLSRSRLKSVVGARHTFMRAMHDAGFSWPEIAALFETSHDSVVHVGGAKEKRLKCDAEKRTSKQIAEWLRARGVDDVTCKGVESLAWKEPEST